MADNTIHSGGGTSRGLIIAVVVVFVFVLGMGLLGSASGPTDEVAPVEESAPAVTN